MSTKSTITQSQTSEIEALKEQHQYFISHLSHEIRNPLTLISSSLQLLEKECPSVTSSKLWPQIREDVQNTIHLLQDVSSLNNLTKQNRSEFSAEEFLSALALSFQSYMEQRNIHFSTQLDASISSVKLNADRRKLQEAITNLLINAADAASSQDSCALQSDASSQDSYALQSADALQDSCTLQSADSSQDFCTSQSAGSKIQLSAKVCDDFLHIHVRDNGSGIPQSYLATLFDPFVTHKSTGTGLGLAIVKRVAELHKGIVTVDTCCEPEHSYTDFCFTIAIS